MKTIATAIAFATTAVLLAPTAAHAEDPTRVLIVGDSVTQGSDGDHTWRYFAARELEGVDFVGNRSGTIVPGAGYNWDGTYADPAFDSDHAARWGLSLYEMRYEPSEIAPSIGSLVSAHQPDVVVETLGINDLNWRYGDAHVGEAVDNARAFVLEARTAKPDVDVVLGTLPQTWTADRVGRYNDALAELAADLSTDASRVTVTEVAPWDRDADTSDGTHPTRSGQEKFAAVVVDALEPLVSAPPVVEPVVTPTPAPVPVPTEEPAPAPAPAAPESTSTPVVVPHAPAPAPPALAAPTAPRKVKAIRDGRKTRLTWQAGAQVEHYVVRCGRAEKTSAGRRAVLRVKAASCSVRSVNSTGASRWVKVRVVR